MSNLVRTTKYTCLNFLPKNLWEQLTKLANAYFLMMAAIPLIPGVAPDGGFATTITPLCLVVGVSMIKDIFEDRKRRLKDTEENQAPCQCMPRGGTRFEEFKTQDIQVGCLVKVHENEFFPCDMYLVQSSLPKGICYVETKNLDGETNLKHKQADKGVLRMAPAEDDCCKIFNGKCIECEGPNEYLYKFEGSLKMSPDESIPINADQILLRGSSLRNTEWVIGVAVYTGHESKIMKNSPNARTKRSMIETRTNRYILYTVLFQVVVCIVGATYSAIWESNAGAEHWYLDAGGDSKSLARQILFTFGVWFVAMINLVPISLLVTLELVKFF